MSELLTTVERDGQRYLDEPVYAHLARTRPIEQSLAMAWGNQPRSIVLRHERIELRWMKPDGKGGLVPRHKEK